MALTLLLDVGNSACKWRLLAAGAPRQGCVYHGGDCSVLLAGLPEVSLGALWVASVLGESQDGRLAAMLESRYGLVPVFYYSQVATLGVSCAYDNPRRLGVDRWLGVVEAWQCYGSALVIDSGSALTIDAVTAEGRHLGGYIVPGLSLLRHSLQQGTADVRVDKSVPADLLLGQNTAEAVGHGTLRMLVAFIDEVTVALKQQLADTCCTVITGGDASLLRPLLKTTTRYQADLVLDGLQRVADATDGSR